MTTTTDYPLEVATKLKAAKKEIPPNSFLREHQYLFLKYFTQVSQFKRGMLAFHGTGTGKTITAEAVVDYYRREEPDRDVVLLMSKSLINNFKDTIRKYMSIDPESTPDHIESTIQSFKFITLGSSNMFTQFEKMDDYDSILKGFLDSERVLEDKILVIDEVHNLANSIVNGSKNATKLYDLIMNTKNVRLIFLTATPMINTPFELVPLFNMLRGYMDEHTLLPENYADFYNLFVRDGQIHNRQKLMNRIYGLVSYYGPEYFNTKSSSDYPEQRPLIVERVPMSDYQFKQYENMRIIERKEEAGSRKTTNAERFSDKSGAVSSYRVKSRQVSNFAYPPGSFTLINGKFRKQPEKITDDDLKDIKTYSPKLVRLLKNLEGKGPDVIYSQFRPVHLERVLQLNNYESWTPGSGIRLNSDEDVLGGGFVVSRRRRPAAKRYAVISGEASAELRSDIIQTWNSPDNIRGAVIKVLIITSAGAEGLDLKYGRRVHILEPFWNEARTEQVIARIVRFRSHVDLPPAEQVVQPYIYLSDYPSTYTRKITEPTTDVNIYENAIRAKNLINEFITMLIEVSVDCEVLITPAARKKYKCMSCNPTHAALYHPDIHKDMKLPNRCTQLVEKKKTVMEINIPELGEKYYYSMNGENVEIYKWNDAVQGYVPLEKDHPHFVELARRILIQR